MVYYDPHQYCDNFFLNSHQEEEGPERNFKFKTRKVSVKEGLSSQEVVTPQTGGYHLIRIIELDRPNSRNPNNDVWDDYINW